MNAPRTPLARPARSLWQGLGTALLLCQATTTLCQAAGSVTAWGANDASQTTVPPSATNVVVAAGGASHSVALRADGTVVAWGFNLSGQATVPANLTNVLTIAAGSTYSMALKSNGTVVVWGSQSAAPAGLTNVAAIAAGWTHSLALKSDGTVVSWGSQTSVPTGLNNVVAIAAGNGQSLALLPDSTVVAWGDNSYNKATVPSGLTNVITIAAGADHSLALKSNGRVVAWGRNDSGQATVPSGLTNAVAIRGGALHSLALKAGGELAAWGDNTYGQTAITPGDSGYISIGAGGYHNLAIKGDGTPFILLQPVDQTALITKSATLQVIATGAQPLGFQWQHYGTNLPNATNSSLSIPSVQATDGGPYVVTVANRFGSATSVQAMLNAVGGPPAVSVPPQDQTVICGDAASFQVVAGGSSPVSYQWQFQDQPIIGATKSSLALTNVSTTQAGTYFVVITNAFGSVTTGAVLTVTVQPPQITSSLTASASQGAPFTYTIRALHTPIAFGAMFLPAGLTINTNTGVISGVPLERGTFGVPLTAFNACTSDTKTLVLTIAPFLPVITSATNATGLEGQLFSYQITALNSPTSFGAQNLPVGLSVDATTGKITGTPTYPGTFDSTIFASNPYGTGSANLHFTIANAAIDNINIGNVSYNYSSPYLLDFQFSLYTLADTNNPNSLASGLVIDPKLLSATCLEDGVTNSSTETAPFLVQGSSKIVKVYLVLDFTESIASLVNGDTNGDGISDAVEFMVSGAEDFVDQQPFDTQIGVYEFHREDMTPSNVVQLTTDKVLLKNSIAGIWTNYVRGFPASSRCWDATLAAVQALGPSNRDEQHFVVLVSDGSDQSSTATMNSVLAAATNASVKIFCLGFGADLNGPTLQTLATATQGSYFPAGSDPAALAQQFAQISKTAKGQYILRWATLKRSAAFMPSFQISYNGLTAYSPTNPWYVDTNNPIIDTNSTPPTTNFNNVTNFIIGYYYPASNGPPAAVTIGSLRVVPDAEVHPTGMNLRATYVPRYIRQLRLHYRANWPCTVSLQNSGPGEILNGWSLVATNDGSGGQWLLLSSPNPASLGTSIPFAAFGKLLTFTFQDARLNTSNAFSVFELDNTLYTNTGQQTFVLENTNQFLKFYSPLPYGTPVPWLLAYGFSGDLTNAEILDPDGDGMLNWQEYRADTNPTNAASVFRLQDLTRLFDGRFQVSFSASTNRVYRVESSPDLLNWQIVQDFIRPSGTNATIIDTSYQPNLTNIFYRALVY